jgi:TetR/AcrR family transcriptional regulator, tetracycline repressor protein
MALSTPSDRLTADTVVETARAMIEEGGVESVTMRRLAARCGVGAATLYGYFRTKDELLGAFADRLFDEIALPADELPWPDRVSFLMRSLYRTLVSHPELAQIIAARPTPGATAPRFLRVVILALDEAGLDERQTRIAHDVLATYTIGFVQREGARRARAPGLAELIADTRAAARRERARAAGRAAATSPDEDEDFNAGLEMIMRGIVATAAAR